jgi:glycosyltransferase involved in cell wall biosynthesis
MSKTMLLVSPEVPRANGVGGEVRIWHLLRGYSEAFDVTLLVLREIKDPGAMNALRAICADVIAPKAAAPAGSPKGVRRIRSALDTLRAIMFPSSRQWSLFWDRYHFYLQCGGSSAIRPILLRMLHAELGILARLRNPPPWPMASHFLLGGLRRVTEQVQQSIAHKRFDVLLLEHSFSFPLLMQSELFRHARLCVCDAHNIESDLLAQQAKHYAQTRSRRRFLAQQAALLRKWERCAFASCDLTLVCSENDRKRAERLAPAASLIVAPNGVDTAYFRPKQAGGESESVRLLFTGNMRYPPNQDAVRFFHADIFPTILSNFPNCRWTVAGRGAASVFGTELGEAVDIVSDPDDIRDSFKGSVLFVVPLRAGSGTRLKILEALAMECPVISTRLGAEGIPYQHGKHLIIADDAAAFAQEIAGLLRDRGRRVSLGAEGGAWIRERYDWKGIAADATAAVWARCESRSDHAPK